MLLLICNSLTAHLSDEWRMETERPVSARADAVEALSE